MKIGKTTRDKIESIKQNADSARQQRECLVMQLITKTDT